VSNVRRIDSRGTINLPVGVRQGLDVVEVVRRDDGVIELRPRLVIDPAQAWFWSDRWQEMERQADLDVAKGRTAAFDDVETFLNDLDDETV
jgi:antitoxin MazE